MSFLGGNIYVVQCVCLLEIYYNPCQSKPKHMCTNTFAPVYMCTCFCVSVHQGHQIGRHCRAHITVLFRAMFPKIIISPSTISAVDFFVKWKYVLLKPATCMYIYIDLFTFWQVWQQWCKCIIIGIYYLNQYTTNKLFHKWKWDRKSYKSMINNGSNCHICIWTYCVQTK